MSLVVYLRIFLQITSSLDFDFYVAELPYSIERFLASSNYLM